MVTTKYQVRPQGTDQDKSPLYGSAARARKMMKFLNRAGGGFRVHVVMVKKEG